MMPLPVLPSHRTPSTVDLLRLFYQTSQRWVEHLAEAQPLPFAQAYINPSLASVADANHVRDVDLGTATGPAEAFEQVTAQFAAQRVACAYWATNPSAPPAQTQPMIDYLLQRGYRAAVQQVHLATQSPVVALAGQPSLTIIPARASFRHAHALFELWAQEQSNPHYAQAAMTHLDDPHYDSLLAISDGQPLAHVGVLAVGPVGRVDQLYVAPLARRRGIGRVMLSRAMELCARSLFDHVMLAAAPDNQPAIRLCELFGFTPIGQLTQYIAPA